MIKQDIGFIIPTLDNNDFSIKACQTINYLIQKNKQKSICIFNQYCETINIHSIPLLPISHAKYFKGNLFVFDLSSLLISANFPLIDNIYFYANNIPWVTSYGHYGAWKKLFSKNNIKVIAGNKHIHDIYNISWNNSISIMEEFSYDKITQCL